MNVQRGTVYDPTLRRMVTVYQFGEETMTTNADCCSGNVKCAECAAAALNGQYVESGAYDAGDDEGDYDVQVSVRYPDYSGAGGGGLQGHRSDDDPTENDALAEFEDDDSWEPALNWDAEGRAGAPVRNAETVDDGWEPRTDWEAVAANRAAGRRRASGPAPRSGGYRDHGGDFGSGIESDDSW